MDSQEFPQNIDIKRLGCCFGVPRQFPSQIQETATSRLPWQRRTDQRLLQIPLCAARTEFYAKGSRSKVRRQIFPGPSGYSALLDSDRTEEHSSASEQTRTAQRKMPLAARR